MGVLLISKLTLEEFSRLPEFDLATGNRQELDHGELIAVPPQPRIHEILKNRICRLINGHLETAGLGGEAFVETGFVLDEDSWRVPDVCYLNGVRAAEPDLWKPWEHAPDLAVEIVSPSESMPALKRKIDHFLAASAKSAWCVFPARHEVHVFKPGLKVYKFTAGTTLEEPEILLGFRLDIDALFE
jgi:Uma2 family endonuclease